MTIIAKALSGNPDANIPPSAEVFSTDTNITITRRSRTLESAIEDVEQIARQMADQDSVLTGATVIRYYIDDEIVKELDHYAPVPPRAMVPGDIDITPSEEEDAVIIAKDLTTDLVAAVIAAVDGAHVDEENQVDLSENLIDEDVIAGHVDVVEPAVEIDEEATTVEAASITVKLSQVEDRVEIEVEADEPFTLWRSIGGRTGTKAISAGSSTHSYKGDLDTAELRVDGPDGLLLS